MEELIETMALHNNLKAVCTIFAEQVGKPSSRAQGVFITPQHVLTAYHCMHGKLRDSVVFENARGDKSGILKQDGKTSFIFDKTHDLAVVALTKPIGDVCLSLPPTASFRANEAPWLMILSRRNKQNEMIPAMATGKLSTGYTLDGEHPHLVAEQFFSPCAMVEGYSGSPVVDSRGHIVSIVSGGFVDQPVLSAVPYKPFRGAPFPELHRIVLTTLQLPK